MARSKAREQALKHRVAEERAAAGKRRIRFSREVRREAVALVLASGEPRDRFAEAMGIGKSSMHKWVTGERRAGRSKFKRMRLDGGGEPRVPTSRDLVLVFPSGVRLTGLDVAQLRVLLGVAS
jgi:transposase-like protein